MNTDSTCNQDILDAADSDSSNLAGSNLAPKGISKCNITGLYLASKRTFGQDTNIQLQQQQQQRSSGES